MRTVRLVEEDTNSGEEGHFQKGLSQNMNRRFRTGIMDIMVLDAVVFPAGAVGAVALEGDEEETQGCVDSFFSDISYR
ncbi:MAG: hypothetical protein EH225_10590 [Calditrichaeota bacterium]|nr:hypothetical protein [Calditrichota bacterium]RQW00084.1 MAG: hypothetical protein EH225_10590 [Calditrichota bacterium]